MLRNEPMPQFDSFAKKAAARKSLRRIRFVLPDPIPQYVLEQI